MEMQRAPLSPFRISVLGALTLAGCGPGGAAGGAGIDTSGLFPVEEGSFLAYRHLTAEAYADPAQASELDPDDLLLSRYERGGACGDWRVELRLGAAWDGASPLGALLFQDGPGLAICGSEDETGAVDTLDAPLPLWVTGSVLEDGGRATAGGWTVTARRAADVQTYFGLFPQTVAFLLEGEGPLDTWELQFADGFGLVLLTTESYTADLVYSR